jgi:uncharacterized membrane protein
MLQYGRILFFILASGLAVLVLGTIRWLPPVVASHFDASGAPNGWSSRPVYAGLLLAIGVLLPLTVTTLVITLTRSGLARLNIPARDYWTRPEHAEEGTRRVRGYMWWLACIMAGTALLTHCLVVAANSRQPARLSTSAILTVLAGVIVGIGAWIAGWYRLLRRPDSR